MSAALKFPHPFESAGLLGMNNRNATYMLKHNQRKFYPTVDDKLKTKVLLDAHQLPTPEIYFSITHNYELKLLREIKFLKEFVVKPARGAEGRGILVIVDRVGNDWIRSNGDRITREDLEYHVANILAGLYSLGGVDDNAFIEYFIRSHACFKNVAFQGAPDIRVVIYRGVPVMCMLRLPTRESGGRANLHQGAVGAGVRIESGITTGGVHHNRLIEKHPDTQTVIGGLQIPFWSDILEIATRVYDVFKLGYIGVDFVVDHILGPLILELNARPGLNIQLANRRGLLPVLKAVDAHGPVVESLPWERRLELSRAIAVLPATQ